MLDNGSQYDGSKSPVPAGPQRVTLVCHPAAPGREGHSVDVTVARDGDGDLRLNYRLQGELATLRVPTAAPPARRDNLWKHTCFELFMAADDGAPYREFNFSPSGQWAAYDFTAYRERSSDPVLSCPPSIDVHTDARELRLAASVAAADLPAGNFLRLGLTAVVEDALGVLSYFALAHPRAQPEFHDVAGFTLRLPME